MARIVVADYGREALLQLESPLVSTLQAWGHEVCEAKDAQDVLQQVRSGHFHAVILYNTLPEVEGLRTLLQQEGEEQGMVVLTLEEKLQQMHFTDMIVVVPQYRLSKNRRQFDIDTLMTLLEATGVQQARNTPERSS